MKTLQKLLGPEKIDLFLSKYFSRIPFSMPNQAKDFSNLVNWEIINNIIDSKKSHLRIVKDGLMVKDYTDLNSAEAAAYYQKGNTLLLKNAERSNLLFETIAKDFSTSFHTEVDIQLYCTPAENNAFGWHYDVEEVFIIQVRGSKEYRIKQNTIHPNPLVSSISKDFKFEKESSDLEITVLLKEGDWLYIPSGWWHIARTKEESMHISIGLMPRSAIDLVSFLNYQLAQSVFWRTRLPIYKEFTNQKEEETFYKTALDSLCLNLEEQFKKPDFLSSFLEHMKKRL